MGQQSTESSAQPQSDSSIHVGRPENYTAAMKQMADWQPAWLRAIALVWSNPLLKNALVANPKAFLREYCGYEIPEHLELTVKADDLGSGWNPGDGLGPDSWTWESRKTELTMFIPKKPDDAQMPIAIAAYEAIGKTYPFTTCC